MSEAISSKRPQSSLPVRWLYGIDSDAVEAPSGATAALRAFIGGPLVVALGALSDGGMLGPWEGWTPAARRKRATFAPVLCSDDHAHDHFEICHLLQGQCLFSFGREACVLETGDIVLIPGRTPHAEAFVRPSVGYQLAWWSLHETEPNLHVTNYERSTGFAIEHGVGLGTLPAEALSRMASLRAMAANALRPGIDEFREALLTLLLLLFRRTLTSEGTQFDARAQIVRRAIEYVRSHTGRRITLSDVAQSVRVSPNYLTSLFRRESGVPLGRFIIEERIAAAQVRLRQPDASVKAVGLELGFADQFAFSKAFKRVTGVAPHDWRTQQAEYAS